MDYKLHTLSSGLRVLTVPMPGLESVTVTIWVKTGSRNEHPNLAGISHFAEHIVFKGSKKRPTAKEISIAVDGMGGEFNAGTTKEWTNFFIKVGKENLEMATDVLSDMIINPILSPEEIEREKGTIIQEIRMYDDTPMIHIGDVFEEVAFDGNQLGVDTAGSEKTVQSIKREDFIKYREEHYHLENMLITIAGSFDETKAIKHMEKYFAGISEIKDKMLGYEKFESKQKAPKLKLLNRKGEQTQLILGFLGDGKGYGGRFAQSLLSVILGGGMSSRMFIEVRERRGFAYAVRTSYERYQDTGYISTYSGVNTDKVEDAIKVILDQCYGLASKKYPITQKELTKAKGFLKGNLALGLEDTIGVSDLFGDQELFNQKVLTPEDIYKEIDKITIKDIYVEAKKLFVPEKLNLAIIGPFKNGEKFKRLLN